MFKFRDAIFATIAAATLLAASGAVPAFADEVAAVPDQPAIHAEVIAADRAREDSPVSDPPVVTRVSVVPPAAPAKRRAVRVVQAPPVRPAAASQLQWGCSGFWCGRQIVLMLGVGY